MKGRACSESTMSSMVTGVEERALRSRMARLRVELKRFLTELSVRPGSMLAMALHLLPSVWCACRMVRSSLADQFFFLRFGFS